MADILIRGIEMPRERSLWLCIKTDGTVYNIKPGGIATAHAVGTAIHIPAGHGRLIDANELELDLVRHNGAIGFELIGNAPTIVPAEGVTDDGTKEELFAAVRLIKEHCTERQDCTSVKRCPIIDWCIRANPDINPEEWPDPEEGGGEDG